MTLLEEQRAVQNVLNGDKDAYEALVLANQTLVYNLALKLTGNESDALDISQEVFLKAYLNLSSYRGGSRLSVWLYRITYNMCIDLIRKNKRQQNIPITYSDENGEDIDIELADTKPLPEEEIERRELNIAVSEAVQQLQPEYRQVFVMREAAGASYENIALSLGISIGTVKSRLARARSKISDILIAKGTIDPPNRHKNRKGGGSIE